MNITKIFWAIRALLYSIFFEKSGVYCYMGKPIFIYNLKNVCTGNRVRIFPGLRLETHDAGRIIFGDDISIGQNFHITSSNGLVSISNKVTILGNVFITNIDHEYRSLDIHIMKQKFICKDTYIGENCFIGYGSCIQAGTKLGKQCVVGANSVVRGEFPDRCVIAGAPAKIIRLYNEVTKEWERV